MPANGMTWPYSDPRWPKLRRAVLARDGYACILCHRGRAHGTILDVDHTIEATKRPDLAFEPSNLKVLCRRCHNRKTHGRSRQRVTSRRW